MAVGLRVDEKESSWRKSTRRYGDNNYRKVQLKEDDKDDVVFSLSGSTCSKL